MSNYSNYKNNQNEDKNDSAASTTNAKNYLMKGKLSSLNSLIKVFAVTLVILALQYSNQNHYGVNEKGVVSGLESSNVRNLSEVNPNFGGSRENLNYSGENINERRNNYNSGNVNSQWGNHENVEPSTYHGTYNYHAPQGTGEQSMGEINLNCFNSGLCQKLKKNGIYIVPGMIAGYYAWNTLGTQTFLLVAAIIGVLLFANQNSH